MMRNLEDWVRRRRNARDPDVTQEAALRFLQRVSAGVPIGDPSRYLDGTARNIEREEFRRRNRERAIGALNDRADGFSISRVVDWLAQPKDEDPLDLLSVSDRELYRRYYEGEAYRQPEQRRRLAEEMGISEGLLKVRIFRLKEKMREGCNREGGK